LGHVRTPPMDGPGCSERPEERIPANAYDICHLTQRVLLPEGLFVFIARPALVCLPRAPRGKEPQCRGEPQCMHVRARQPLLRWPRPKLIFVSRRTVRQLGVELQVDWGDTTRFCASGGCFGPLSTFVHQLFSEACAFAPRLGTRPCRPTLRSPARIRMPLSALAWASRRTRPLLRATRLRLTMRAPSHKAFAPRLGACASHAN
jgi:hypothetical protein